MAGNRRTATENNNDAVTWTYDNANQLTVEEHSGYLLITRSYNSPATSRMPAAPGSSPSQ